MLKMNSLTRLMPLAALLAMGHLDTLYGQFTVSPTSLSFSALTNGALPASQSFTVSSGGQFNVSITYVGQVNGWLSISPPTTGIVPPAVVTANITSSNLGPGTYQAFINVTGGQSPAVSIAVNYTVSAGVTLTANPPSLTFNYQVGTQVPASKEITLNSSGAAVPANITVNPGCTQVNWLVATPTSLNTGQKITVSVTNVNQLPLGPCTGIITVSSPNASQPLSIPVTINVGNNPVITASSEQANFYFQTGGTVPPPEVITFTSTGVPVVYFVNSTQVPWLIVTPTNSNTETPLSISVSPLSLQPGTYTGTVTVGFQGAANAAIVIPVTLIVSNQSLINTSPSSLSFNYQAGTGAPASKTISVSSTGSATNYTTVASTTTGGNWLTITPASGTTPAQITVGVDANVASGLGTGTYTGKVTVTAPGAGNSPREVPVTLTINNLPLLTAFPADLSFGFQIGKQNPASQILRIRSTGTPFTFNAVVEGAQWLSISPGSGTTGSTDLVVTANPGTLTQGQLQGKIRVTADGAGNSPLEIPVTFTVSNTPLLIVNPAAVEFSVQVGSSTVQQTPASVTSSDPAVPIAFQTTASTNSGGGWLAVTGGGQSTPTNLSVLALPGGLQVGTYTGQISISAGGLLNSPQKVAATLRVTPNATITAAPAALTFTQTAGGSVPSSQTLQITSAPTSNVTFTASASTTNGGAWLTIQPSGTQASPSTITVSVNQNQLTPGSYTGAITIASTQVSNSPVTIPVTLTVGGSLIVTPSTLAFTWQQGGVVPTPQTIAVSLGQGTGSIQASTNASWLLVNPGSGSLPRDLTVSINPAGLAPGTYNAKITLVSQAATAEVPVTLTVTATTCSVDKPSLIFTQPAGGAAPADQVVQFTCPGPRTFTVETSANTPWLSITPLQGTSPQGVTVKVNGSNLTPAQYNGTVTIRATGVPAVAVAVVLSVTTPPINPVISAVVNAASQQSIDLSPGMIITIYGQDLGPLTPAGLTVDGGKVTTIAGNTRVFFDNVAAPILYASRTQVNTIVPYGVGNSTTTRVLVDFAGVRTAVRELRVAPSGPAIFTQNGTGTGPGAILNQDNSYNSVANPAGRGSVIQIFGTGEGLTTPAGVDGLIVLGLIQPNLPVTATIGGVEAVVEFAGSAPSLVSGAFQVNLRISPNTPPGAQPVSIRVGNAVSQLGVTVQVN